MKAQTWWRSFSGEEKKATIESQGSPTFTGWTEEKYLGKKTEKKRTEKQGRNQENMASQKLRKETIKKDDMVNIVKCHRGQMKT